MTTKISGAWSLDRIHAHLDGARMPVRIASKNPSGFPVVTSLWYLYREGALWCATQASASVARYLTEDPRCGFEVAGDSPPYRGVRGWGRARIVQEKGKEILRALIARYLGDESAPVARWLLSRASTEVAIRINPQRLVSWDYSGRMGGAP